MRNIAFYAGSFDPFTNGHLQIVKVASETFNELLIGIGINPDKTPRFDKRKMKVAIEETLMEEKIDNARVIIYDNDTWQAAKENDSSILIRGLRNETDYRYEEKIANYNDEHGIETIYLRAKSLGNLSSSFVYKEYKENRDISSYVPGPVKELILKSKV